MLGTHNNSSNTSLVPARVATPDLALRQLQLPLPLPYRLLGTTRAAPLLSSNRGNDHDDKEKWNVIERDEMCM